MATGRQHKRRFPFQGPAVEYAVYLEDLVLKLETKVDELHKALKQQSPSHQSPPTENNPNVVFHIENPQAQENHTEPWVTAGANFLGILPISRAKWDSKVDQTLLVTPEQRIAAYKILTLQPLSIPNQLIHGPSQPTSLALSELPRLPSRPSQPTSPLVLVEVYQKLRLILESRANHSAQINAYSDLIWHCICLVARNNGMSVENVDNLTTAVLPRRVSSKYKARLRRAAGLVACMIAKLETKLGYLGSYVFLLCCPGMTTFRNWTEHIQTEDYIIQDIQNKFSSMSPLPEIHISFSPAFVIAYLGVWNLDQVNQALGTELSVIEYEARKEDLISAEAALIEPVIAGEPGLNNSNSHDCGFQPTHTELPQFDIEGRASKRQKASGVDVHCSIHDLRAQTPVFDDDSDEPRHSGREPTGIAIREILNPQFQDLGVDDVFQDLVSAATPGNFIPTTTTSTGKSQETVGETANADKGCTESGDPAFTSDELEGPDTIGLFDDINWEDITLSTNLLVGVSEPSFPL